MIDIYTTARYIVVGALKTYGLKRDSYFIKTGAFQLFY